ncbi:MAG: helix-turn-helix domain-containing protein [Caulobacterales bacterium]
MPTARLTLLLHPVRIRLVNAMYAGGALTTSELCARMPDLPKATLYRQVERLLRGGVFEVESERQVRGTVERRFRLAEGGALVDEEAARSMTLEDHRRGFTAAMAALIGDFNVYLDRGDADPLADQVSYRQYTLWLRPQERSRLIREVWRTLVASSSNKPGAGRAPYVFSTVFFPTSAGKPSERPRPGTTSRRSRSPPAAD